MKDSTQTAPATASFTSAPRVDAASAVASSGPGLLPRTREEIQGLVKLYAANPLFAPVKEQVIEDNPFRRPVDQQAAAQHDFSTSLTRTEMFGASALAAQRMLFNIYETDFVFLPERNFAARRSDFARFYSNENKLLGELIRPALEAHVFGFLDEEIDITGKWSAAALQSYLQALVKEHEQSELAILPLVLSCADPQRAALTLLIQVAGDFLTESSSSARNLLGKFGEAQSELFKIAIDDYGFGVHPAKHSTLFEKTLATCGLSADAHAYWHFYLPGSLALNNYYHYVCRDHSKFFRAIGAVAIGESLFAHTCRQFSKLLRAVFGDDVDTYYFDEHYHIDEHHGRMAVENVVLPVIAKYGDAVIPEIVRGIEELRAVSSLADEDYTAQVTWADRPKTSRTQAEQLVQSGLSPQLESRRTTSVMRRDEAFITRVCDTDRLLRVESGSLVLVAGHEQSTTVEAGQSIIIPRQRLHGLSSAAPESLYHSYEMEGA